MKKLTVNILLNLLCVILGIIIVAPLAWILLNSLKTNQELFKDSLALPNVWQFGNYVKAWNLGLYRYFGNSLSEFDFPDRNSGDIFFSGLWIDSLPRQRQQYYLYHCTGGNGTIGTGGTGSPV